MADMLQPPSQQPLAHELDPLDVHLADLEEEPGVTFLQDFLTQPLDTAALTATPLSSATDTPNGYTSEDTDYSGATPPPPPAYHSQQQQQQQQQQYNHQYNHQYTGPGSPSDEQMYQDMSFLQSADTNELVEVVADFCSTEDLTTLSPQQQRKFANKVIKGKTSKYRGVTQTSKTSWGAKYSAKRITNTCKTPDEAAHAYDMYLKQHYPQKYSKFANFCEKCGRFVNPLGLPEYKNECGCTDRAQYASPSAGDVTSPESSTAGSPVSASSSSDSAGAANEQFRGSSLSIGSMKFSFSDDTDKFFDESLSMVASFETASAAAATEQQQQQQQQLTLTYPEYKPASPPPSAVLQKHDSIPLAVISSAVESFTQEDNLDQIIEDINRPSSATSFAKPQQIQMQNQPRGSTSELQHGIEPTSASSTYVDFSMDELQDLSEYFLADQFVPPESMTLSSTSGGVSVVPAPTNGSGKQAYLKKIHSLDYDSTDAAMDGTDVHDSIKQECTPHVLLQTSSMQDIDAIANSFMHPSRPHAVAPSMLANAFPAVIDIETPFLEKYWRNDRKNIQCFPYCPEHGDYYRVRIEDLQHRCKGVCRAAVKARVRIPTTQPLAPQALHVLARCNSTFSRNVTLSTQAQLSAGEMKTLQALSAVGVVDAFSATADGSGVQFDVTFYPDVWKFEFDLPKKRRNISTSSPVETDADHLGSEFLYFFEIDVFYAPDARTFERLGHTESINFQIGNTRTLLRQRNKMTTEDATPTPTTDSDRVLDIDALPEKKKIKMHRGQLALTRSSIIDDSAVDASLVAHDTKVDASGSNSHNSIPAEAIASGVQYSAMRSIPKKPIDVDPYVHTNAKDAAFDMELGDSGVATPQGHETQSSNYNPYLSPKPKDGALAVASTSAGAATATAGGSTSTHKATPADETYSLSKLFPYALLCVPLSFVYVPLSLLLLVAFFVLPPLAPSIVRVLDTLSDTDLRNANSSCIARDPRRVLKRLSVDATPNSPRPFLRYHTSSDVYARFAYFLYGKLFMSVVAFVPTLVLSVLAVVTFPIQSVSTALKRSACSCALWTREFTRKSVGKPFTGGQRHDTTDLV